MEEIILRAFELPFRVGLVRRSLEIHLRHTVTLQLSIPCETTSPGVPSEYRSKPKLSGLPPAEKSGHDSSVLQEDPSTSVKSVRARLDIMGMATHAEVLHVSAPPARYPE